MMFALLRDMFGFLFSDDDPGEPRPKRPPCPAPDDPGYVEWLADHGATALIRACAASAIEKATERRYDEERLRRIIREELDRDK